MGPRCHSRRLKPPLPVRQETLRGREQAGFAALPPQLTTFAGAHGYSKALRQARRERLAAEPACELRTATPAELRQSAARTRALVQTILDEADALKKLKGAELAAAASGALPPAASAAMRLALPPGRHDKDVADPRPPPAMQVVGPAFAAEFDRRRACSQPPRNLKCKDDEVTAQLQAARCLAQELTMPPCGRQSMRSRAGNEAGEPAAENGAGAQHVSLPSSRSRSRPRFSPNTRMLCAGKSQSGVAIWSAEAAAQALQQMPARVQFCARQASMVAGVQRTDSSRCRWTARESSRSLRRPTGIVGQMAALQAAVPIGIAPWIDLAPHSSPACAPTNLDFKSGATFADEAAVTAPADLHAADSPADRTTQLPERLLQLRTQYLESPAAFREYRGESWTNKAAAAL